MSLEKMEALEVRVKRLVDMVRHLKQANDLLQEKLDQTHERLGQQESLSRDWEKERVHIRTKIEKVLDDLHFLEPQDGQFQEVIHDEHY